MIADAALAGGQRWHARHLPVASSKKLTGIVSIGDIAKSQRKKFENGHFRDYIQD